MSAKEKEAAAKQTFTFLAPLTNEYPVKQDKECGSTIASEYDLQGYSRAV